MNMTESRRYSFFLLTFLIVLAGSICLKHNLDGSKKTSPLAESTEIMVSPVINIIGRYAVGIKTFWFDQKIDENVEKLTFDIIKETKGLALKPPDQVCLIPFIAELNGIDAAYRYIATLAANEEIFIHQDILRFEKIYKQGPTSLDFSERNELLERYRWAARIALSFGLADDDPERSTLLKAAKRTFLLFLGLTLAVFAAGFLGFIFMTITIVKMVRGKSIWRFSPKEFIPFSARNYLLETMILFLLANLLMNIFDKSISQFLLWTIYLLLPLILIWPKFRGMDWQKLTRTLGWNKGKGIGKEIISGIVGYITGVPLIILGITITYKLITLMDVYPIHPIVYEFNDADYFKIARLFFLACVMAPLLEESLFRGAFYSYLRLKNSILISACISGILFAAIHPQGLVAIPALACIGLVFSLIREWRDSLIASVTAHALNNTVVTTILLFNIAK